MRREECTVFPNGKKGSKEGSSFFTKVAIGLSIRIILLMDRVGELEPSSKISHAKLLFLVGGVLRLHSCRLDQRPRGL